MDLTQTASPSEAARILGVSGETIRSWCNSGRLAYVRTPLGRLVPTREVERVRNERATATANKG